MPRKTIAGLEAQLEALQEQYTALQADHEHNVVVNNNLRDSIESLQDQLNTANGKVFDLEVLAKAHRKVIGRFPWQFTLCTFLSLATGAFTMYMVLT